MGERCYVYAITASDAHLPASVSGIGGPLLILPYKELGAVVSRIGSAEVDGLAPASTAENLVRHEHVVEAVSSSGALPVRFGTILPTFEAVTQAMAMQYDALLADLRRVGDKVEMGVTALWKASSPAPASERDPKLNTPPGLDATSADRRGLAYLHERQAAYRHTAAARQRAQELARDLDATLRPFVLDSHHSPCPSPRIVLRARYLLEREQASAFQQAFDEVRQHQMEVRLLLSGPWPPYSFVTPSAHRDLPGQSLTNLGGHA